MTCEHNLLTYERYMRGSKFTPGCNFAPGVNLHQGANCAYKRGFSLPSWCLVIVVWLCLAVSWVCLHFVIVVFPDHTHLLFLLKFVLEEL